MVAVERVVDVPKRKMIKFGKSKRTNCAIPASQSCEFGQQRVRISFQGKVIMSNSKETSSGCRKRRRPDKGVAVGAGCGPMEKRQRMDSCETQQCFALLEELMKHPVSGSFLNQTLHDPNNSPECFTITRNPMDLGIVRSKLANNTYLGIQDFEADIRRAFYNAVLHRNPPLSNVLKMAEELNGILQARWKSLGDNWKHQQVLKVGQGKVSGIRSNSRCTHSKSEEKVVNVKLPLNARAPDEVEPPKPSKLARTNLRKSPNSNSRNGRAQGSISNANAKPPLSQGARKCSSCGSIKCQCRLPVDSNHASSRINATSERSLGGKIRVCNAADASNKLDCQAKNTLTSEMRKSDPDCDGAQLKTPATDAASDKGLLTDPIFNVQMSPKKALRAAMLKSRFADIILKAQQTMILLAHGDKADPVRMLQEKEKLKTRLREEKAKVEAHIRVAESAAKVKREKEREAARIALQKMENTAGIEVNLEIERELEILTGWSLSCGKLHPLSQLGLILKDEHLEDDDDDEAVLHDDLEEGEILP